jgi:predicted ATPase/DNA-binding winged helix-turn-helix (wHTH) protein
MTSPTVYRFGPFELDPAQAQLRRDGVVLPLRQRPMALLRVLLQRPGELLDKDELLAQAWPGLVVEENNLQVQVSVLRKLLGAQAIATVAGRGYRFTWPVERRAASAATAPAAAVDDLVGRDAERALLAGLLAGHRLVTVLGPGGIGKTRLARSVVQGPAADGPLQWVDLAELGDPAWLASRLLAALPRAADDVPSQDAGPDVEARLLERLAGECGLVVLDNAEHLIDAVAALLQRALSLPAGPRWLVTSQAPLRLPEERRLRLWPLAVPEAEASVDEARACGAVALFVQRVAQGDPQFHLDAGNCPAVVDICRRLDGVPLALELAAARVPAFGLRAVAERLDERFRQLQSGYRSAPQRQRTLQAVYDWTFGLLPPAQQALFRRLGVVQGELPLNPLLALVRDEGPASPDEDWALCDALAGLVEHSLVQLDDGDPPRYRLLESARADALQRLVAAGEHAALWRAVAWYEQAGDRAAEAAGGMPALQAFGHALELLRRLPATPVRDERELQLALKLGPAIQSTLGPAHTRCESVYARALALARERPPDQAVFQALWGWWQCLSLAGRDREAAPWAQQIVELAQRLGDDGLELEALHALMTTCDLLGEAPAVVAHAKRITAMYDCSRHHRLTFAFGGHDPGVCALGQGAVNLWLCGCGEEALAMAGQALALAATLDHGYSRATGAFYAAITYAAARHTDDLARTATALVSVSDEHGMAMLRTEGRFFVGRARFEQGAREDGIATMRDELAAIEASQDLAFVFVYVSLLADALVAAGVDDEAHALLQRALQHAQQGQGLFLPEVLRLRGLLRWRAGDAGGRDEVEQALELARRQGAVALQARAEATLAELGAREP